MYTQHTGTRVLTKRRVVLVLVLVAQPYGYVAADMRTVHQIDNGTVRTYVLTFIRNR